MQIKYDPSKCRFSKVTGAIRFNIPRFYFGMIWDMLLRASNNSKLCSKYAPCSHLLTIRCTLVLIYDIPNLNLNAVLYFPV